MGYSLGMNKNVIFFIIVLAAAGLNLGTVRKAEDPIRDTQTNPILYEQKKEEEKDGKKGPLLYHVKNYPRESFFIDPPYEVEKKTSAGEAVKELAPASLDTAGWWEEQPTASQTESSVEAASEPLPELLPGEEKTGGLEVPEQPAPGADAGNAPSAKGDDYWW